MTFIFSKSSLSYSTSLLTARSSRFVDSIALLWVPCRGRSETRREGKSDGNEFDGTTHCVDRGSHTRRISSIRAHSNSSTSAMSPHGQEWVHLVEVRGVLSEGENHEDSFLSLPFTPTHSSNLLFRARACGTSLVVWTGLIAVVASKSGSFSSLFSLSPSIGSVSDSLAVIR